MLLDGSSNLAIFSMATCSLLGIDQAPIYHDFELAAVAGD